MLKKISFTKNCVTWKVKVPYVVPPSIKIFSKQPGKYSFSFFCSIHIHSCVCEYGQGVGSVCGGVFYTDSSIASFDFFPINSFLLRGILTPAAQIQVNPVTQDQAGRKGDAPGTQKPEGFM